MNKRIAETAAIALVLMLCFGVAKWVSAQGKAKPGAGFVAVPDEKNGQDISGAYEVVPDWPKPLSQLPGHEKWTWGAMQGVYAETPNRIFIVMRGELPLLKRPLNTPVPESGPSLSFPVNQTVFRNASQGPVASLVGPEPLPSWKGKIGVDARWEHSILVVDGAGNIVEQWTQWDKILRQPHSIHVNPYDPEKNIWIADARAHVIYKFSNDGKKLLQTIGTPNQPGADATHFNRPTFLAWLPDGTLFVADGYVNHRVAKFDKDGKFLMDWGKEGNAPDESYPGSNYWLSKESRPGYFNTVHGIVVDPATRRVYVNDRDNRRIQVFDENGKFLDQWTEGSRSQVMGLYMSADRHIWAGDGETMRILKFDLQGHFLYSFGTMGDWPGAIYGVHQISVDQDGNLYVAEVLGGRAQKFRPRKGANPDFLIGQPLR